MGGLPWVGQALQLIFTTSVSLKLLADSAPLTDLGKGGVGVDPRGPKGLFEGRHGVHFWTSDPREPRFFKYTARSLRTVVWQCLKKILSPKPTL